MITLRRMVGYWPDPAYPLSSNEKYTWRKLYDRNPWFTVANDKLAAKRLARELCPGIRVPRTLWEGTCAEDIPDEVLQGDVVVKANHGSGWNLFVQAGKY